MLQLKLEKIFSYKKTIIIIFLLLTLLFAYSARNVRTDFDFNPKVSNSTASPLQTLFVNENNLSAKNQSALVSIVISDPDLFTLSNFQLLKKLELQLLSTNLIENITSLFSLPDANYYFEHQVEQPLISGEEKTIRQLNYIKYQATHNKLLLNRFVNPTATTIAFYARLKPMSKQELYKARETIELIIQSYQPKFEAIYQIGGLEIETALARMSNSDLALLGSIAILLLIIIYGAFFRHILIGLVPFFTSAVASVWSLGILAYINIPINILCAVTMVIVFVVGAMECAHFINAHQRSYDNHPNKAKQYHAAYSLRHVFWPIFFAMLTTILGFLFNIFSSIHFLVDFSIAISIGIAANTIIVCCLVPLVLGFFLPKYKSNKLLESLENAKSVSGCVNGDGIFVLLLRLVLNVHDKICARSNGFVLLIVTTVVLGIFLAPKIPTEIIPYVNFYHNSPLMNKVYKTNQILTGTRSFSVYISSTEPQAFTDKKNIDQLFSVEQEIDQLPETSSTISVASALAALRQVYLDAGEDMSQYKIPDSKDFINSILPAINHIGLSGGWLANNNQVAKLTIYYQLYTTTQFKAYLDNINQILRNSFENTSLSYEIENTTVGVARDVQQVIAIQLISISIIYFGIFLVMWFAFKSYKAGIVSVIPNVFPLACILILMWSFKIPFYPITIIILAAVLGLAVDNTIHIMLSFRKFYFETGEVNVAIRRAVSAQFRPVTITSIALVAGISVLAFSSLKSTMLFAVLLGFGSLMAWIADVMITPFLLRKINVVNKLNSRCYT